MPSELSLSDQYLITCKGAKYGRELDSITFPVPSTHLDSLFFVRRGQWILAFNLIRSDAELGRMMKALVWHTDDVTISELNGIYVCTAGAFPPYEGESENEAAARACSALKLQVPNGDEA